MLGAAEYDGTEWNLLQLVFEYDDALITELNEELYIVVNRFDVYRVMMVRDDEGKNEVLVFERHW